MEQHRIKDNTDSMSAAVTERPPSKRLSFYEREMIKQKERESKLEQLRRKEMEECTFTPKTTNTNRTVTTASPSTSGESVFSRLYRGDCTDSMSWTVKGQNLTNRRYSLDLTHTGRLIDEHSQCSGSIAGTKSSSRIEQHYMNGVQKLRARPLSEKEEKDIRQRNIEERQMDQCTFHPQTKWGKKLSKPTNSKKSKIVMQPALNRKQRPARQYGKARTRTDSDNSSKENPPLPKEIVVDCTNAENPEPFEYREDESLEPDVSDLSSFGVYRQPRTNRSKKTSNNDFEPNEERLQQQERRTAKIEKKKHRSSRRKVYLTPEYGSV